MAEKGIKIKRTRHLFYTAPAEQKASTPCQCNIGRLCPLKIRCSRCGGRASGLGWNEGIGFHSAIGVSFGNVSLGLTSVSCFQRHLSAALSLCLSDQDVLDNASSAETNSKSGGYRGEMLYHLNQGLNDVKKNGDETCLYS
jgi:hypothetical protein